MPRLTNNNLLVRTVDAAEEIVERCAVIYNFPFTQLFLCEGGSGFLVPENGVETPFGEGALFCAEPGLSCGIRTEEGLAFKKIACDTAMAPHLQNYFDSGMLHLLDNCSDELLRLFRELYRLCFDPAASENKNTSLCLYRVLIMLGQEISGKNGNEKGSLLAMARVYEKYIFENYKAGEKIGAPPEINALFIRVFNMDVDEYNVYFRYERSKPFVCFRRNFGEVARYLGFASEKEFVSGFTRRFGITPEEYLRLFI